MAAFALTTCTVQIGTAWAGGSAPGLPGTQTVAGTVTIASGADFSVYAIAADLPMTQEMKETTNFGSGGFKAVVPGLYSAAPKITFNQDFAASALDVYMWARFSAGSLLYIDIKPTSAARSATNPSFVYAAYLGNYSPISSVKVGDVPTLDIPLMVTGQFAKLTT